MEADMQREHSRDLCGSSDSDETMGKGMPTDTTKVVSHPECRRNQEG